MHLLITQPYLPAYRIPLFAEIRRQLEDSGDSLTLVVGKAQGDQAKRGDSLTANGVEFYSKRSFKVGSRDIDFRKMPHSSPRPDVIVSELEALNTFAWKETFSKTPLVLWGHGKSYVTESNQLGDKVEWALARRAQHIMTYSPSGRDYLVQRGGLRASRVTAIGNSTDTDTLRAATIKLRTLQSEEIDATGKRQALFVGGLDASKRIDFLLEAAEIAHDLDEDFRLIVVGRGALEGLVDELAAQRTYITRVPESRGAQLAALGVESDALWMPGRVGLVAVDALAMGLPVHTTDHEFHAPEMEFLNSSEVAILPDTPEGFARSSLTKMSTTQKLQRPLRSDIPSIRKVATEFVNVVMDAYSSSPH